jgi:hypothetical protein
MKLDTYLKNEHSFHLLNENIFDLSNKRISSNEEISIVIPHVCNNVNAFGAGFADAVADKYPVVKANFHVNGSQKLGHTQFITAKTKGSNKLVIANMIAQNGLINPKNKRPLHYPSLIKCMYDVLTFCKNIQNNNDSKVEIHAPKFGSGLAGGNWLFIADLIDDIWSGIDTFIYIKR